jgi:NitT/TauT family transport system permease protein
VLAMLIGVLLYDQLFFRPLLAWSDKFRFEEIGGAQEQSSWLLTWIRRTERLQLIGKAFARLIDYSIRCSVLPTMAPRSGPARVKPRKP